MSRRKINSSEIIIALWFIAISVVGAHGEDRALLIGVEKFVDRRIPSLPGCENDAREVAALLTQGCGMADAQIKLLLSREASRTAILTAMQQWLVEGTSPGDRVILYFSGHGSQVPDDNGDESDKYDEILCPSDYDPRSQKNGLRDDELGTMLERLDGRNVTIILDACHCGTAYKSINGLRIEERSYPTVNVMAKYVTPPWTNETDPPAWPAEVQTRSLTSPEMGTMQDEIRRNEVFYSACSDGQRAEIGAFVEDGKVVWRSIFTRAFLKGMSGQADSNRDGKITNAEMSGFLRDTLISFAQTPMMTCEQLYRGQLVFGRTLTLGGPARIFFAEDRMVVINRGHHHGVSKNDLFQTALSKPDAEEAVRIQIDRVDSFLSFGQASKSIRFEPPGPEVLLMERPRPEPVKQLHIYLGYFTNPVGEALKFPPHLSEMIAACPELAIEPDQAAADRIVTGSIVADGTLNVFIYGRFGRLQSQFSSSSELAPEQLVRRLKGQLLLEKLAALDQPLASFQIHLEVQDARKEYFIYPPDDPRRETVTFTIRTERDCHLVLLAIDSQGEITLLWPNRWQSHTKLEAGRVYKVPEPGADFIFPVRLPPGQDTIKAIATLQPIDLRDVNAKGLQEQGFIRFRPDQQIELIEDIMARGIGVERNEMNEPAATNPALTDVPRADWTTATLALQTYLPPRP